MLDYWVRLYRLYRLPITQVVVLLLPPAPDTIIETSFNVETTRHEYRVIRIWKENATQFLNDPALLPFAPLTATTQPQILLQQVVERVNQLEAEKPEAAYTQILAGLKYNKELIQRIFREGMMRESVIYQEILAEGEQIGEQQGRLAEGRSLVLHQLNRRIGELPPDVRQQIESLSLEQLENLAEALLDFQQIADLEAWLHQGV
ncbi:Rpn family recombination-promoting nuclease/putative transposase [Gloeocapsopsis crepidinum]|uniref:Rpn family recombination-promoting nuclease/putative transposase n=1 Tax=Gloeocapsopsis crepidinum TaxID=693223 RepID=UPI001D140D7C|nr:Rpn family recombination-promoting nuclease/putative transposase [Gloeocapsopsis crepidinum]